MILVDANILMYAAGADHAHKEPSLRWLERVARGDVEAIINAETLQEVVRLQGYDMPGIGKVDAKGLRALLVNVDGSAEVDAALAVRPNDAAMRFAAALIAAADQRKNDYATHARVARSGATHDRLLALNLHQIAN